MGRDGCVVRVRDLVATPWPNGRGLTRDIVRRTRADGAIDWLVSLAELGADAPFSHFPGIDRIFTLVSGGPVELAVGPGAPMRCGLLVPAHFPGDVPTGSRLLGGAGRALNAFVDRGRRRARVATLALAAGHAVPLADAVEVLYCVSGSVEVDGARVGPDDVLTGAGAGEARAVAGPAVLVAVEIAGAG